MTDTTPNTDTGTDTFDNLSDLLASAGYTAEVRKRLTLAPEVIKALANGSQAVVVLGTESDASDHAAFVSNMLTIPNVEVLKSGTESAKVRPHVASFAKSRKVALAIAPVKSADNTLIGYMFQRSAK